MGGDVTENETIVPSVENESSTDESVLDKQPLIESNEFANEISENENRISATDYTNNLSQDDKTLVHDLGWINYYRGKATGENSYFNYFGNMFNRTYDAVVNNVIVKTAKNAVENAITTQTQTLAETLNLVKPGEHVLELDSDKLDERIDKLQTMLKDPGMQKHIAETSKNVTEAMKKPLEDAVAQLSSLVGEFSKDASEQGMLALGNAVKIIPVAGNVISGMDLLNNVEKLGAKAVESVGKTMDIVSDAEFDIQLGLKKQEIEKIKAIPVEFTVDQVNAKIQIYDDVLENEIIKLKAEVDDLNKQITDKKVASVGDATLKISGLKSKIEEYEAQKMELMTNDKTDVIVNQTGGAKMVKGYMNTSKQTLKRVNECLKSHFNKCVTRKSLYGNKDVSKKKRGYKKVVKRSVRKH